MSGSSPTCGRRCSGISSSCRSGFYERNRAGVIISRLTNDIEAIDQLVTDGVTVLVQSR